jgi:DNA repair exonuclease SbcCD ATPase subunit
MIIFKTVKWKNFLSTGNSFTEIKLDNESSTLIIGENGSGKSTILDALCFGLYGKPFRSINKPQLINSVNQRELEVEVEFAVSGKHVKVCRGIKPNKFEIYVQNKLVTQDAALKDYQQFLEQQILKLNYRSFTQVVILGSSTFVPFMQLSARDRREVVEDILDIRIFTLMNAILKGKNKSLLDNIQENEYQIQLAEEKIQMQKKYIKSVLENKENIIDERQQKIQDNKEIIQNKAESKKTLLRKLEELREALESKKEATKKLTKLRKTHAALENKWREENKILAFFDDNKVCPTCTQDIDEDIRKTKIKEKHEKVHEIGDALNELKSLENIEEDRLKEFEILEEEISNISIKVATIDSSIKMLEDIIKKSIKEIEQITNNEVNDQDKEELIKLETQLEIYNNNKLRLNEERTYLDVAKNLLQDAGIKTKIIKKYLPIMNKLINAYLSQMDFYVSFNLDSSFNETILSRHRDDFKYPSFSEGEKMRIDLALLFTWRAIAKIKNSTNTNLLILDEIFDSSLDGAGTDDFLKILNTFTNQNVFVISHKQDILFDKFRSVIQFKKEKNFSRIAA